MTFSAWGAELMLGMLIAQSFALMWIVRRVAILGNALSATLAASAISPAEPCGSMSTSTLGAPGRNSSD